MLDNFGMGEFLMLAIFALLFFGPERLPQMGARLGRWLGQLTQASKVFMSQWTEEAAAIQDAVREVQGIRDEIRAAQAEISGSLDVARQDIEQTIGEARSTVRDAAVTPRSFLKAGEEANSAAQLDEPADKGPLDTSSPPRLATQEEVEKAAPAAISSSGETQALSKTQSVLDDLIAKRGLSPAATDQPGDDGAESTEADAQDAEYERNLKAIQEIQERDARRAAEKAQKSEAETDQAAAPSTQPAALSLSQEQANQAVQVEQDAKPAQENAFDKTQRILDGLLGKTTPEPAAETASTETASAETSPEKDVPGMEQKPASSATAKSDQEKPLQETAAVPESEVAPDRASGVEAAAAEIASQEPALPDHVQRVTSLQKGVSFGEFTKLSIQVTQLTRELRTLQKELQSLRVQSPVAPKPGAAAEDDSQAATMEEAA